MIFWMKKDQGSLPVFSNKKPDLNQLDFGNWCYLKNMSFDKSHINIESLKASIKEQWATKPMDYFIKTCNTFRPRIKAIIAFEG